MKIFLVTRISGNKSIFLFGLRNRKLFTTNRKSFAFNLMLTFLHTVYTKNRMEAWGCYAALRKQEDIKNVDHMMVNYDIATVREFIFCT